jgi:hypothetical protein
MVASHDLQAAYTQKGLAACGAPFTNWLLAQVSTYSTSIQHASMSGFEVAGVVLGALPLVLYAFEHYSDGVSPCFCPGKAELTDYLNSSP